MKEARCGAAFLEKFVPVSRIEGNVPRLRAKSVHFVGYLPPRTQKEAILEKRRGNKYREGQGQIDGEGTEAERQKTDDGINASGISLERSSHRCRSANQSIDCLSLVASLSQSRGKSITRW